jgi:nucleotide-binding universal stress UspA family protein
MKIEKILTGIDFGPKTERIFTYASYFARKMNAALHLLYVLDYIVTPPVYLTPYIEEEKKNAEKSFDAIKKLFHSADIKTETEVIIGRLQESFDVAIKKTHADMLLLGFMTHTFRRSSSEKLIKGLQIPMLVVRGEKSDSASVEGLAIRKMLCPVDFSEHSKKAFTVAMQLKDTLSAKLDILYVSPDYMINKMGTSQYKDRALQELKEKAKQGLNTFLKDLSVKEAGFIDEGDPSKKIISFLKENDIDLVIMGARGLGLIKGMLIGSVTDAVLKTSPCPVLVIH